MLPSGITKPLHDSGVRQYDFTEINCVCFTPPKTPLPTCGPPYTVGVGGMGWCKVIRVDLVLIYLSYTLTDSDTKKSGDFLGK